MSAIRALKAARAAGVRLGIDGDDLTLEADAAPPPDVLDVLARQKLGVIALLRVGSDGLSGEDWRAFFDERAAIAEFDGGLPREQAEARAHACCVAEWLNRNPVRSSPDSCLRCGEAEQGHDPLLPLGNEVHRPRLASFALLVGLACREASRATDALEAMGIATPAGFPNDFDKKGGA